ncbi:O-fucosyltransferase 39 [Glycine soja]
MMELGYLNQGHPFRNNNICHSSIIDQRFQDCVFHFGTVVPYTLQLTVMQELNPIKPRHSRILRSVVQCETPTSQLSKLWSPLESQGWKPYVESNKPSELHYYHLCTLCSALLEKSEGYIQVFLDGGLNQQKMGFSIKSLLSRSKICDAVVVAKILNATLVIPYLELNPVWRDSSSFMDIFDVDHFIDVLKNDISIVRVRLEHKGVLWLGYSRNQNQGCTCACINLLVSG